MTTLANRVRVNTATTGTGTVTLGSASSNASCTFAEAGVTDGSTVAYLIEEGNDFEIGVGTYTASGTTLSRTTVRLSKIGGTSGTTKMNLAGSARVSIVAAKEDLYYAGGTDVAVADGGTGASTATAGFDALSPVTTRGDLIYRNASNNARLAVGAVGQVLGTDGTDPAWGTLPLARLSKGLTPHENLKVKYASASTVTSTADGVILFNSNGDAKRFTSLSATASIASTGAANQLDTGSEASSTWYHIWAIGKEDGTVASLLSTSATAPTLPSGYTYKGYIGAAYNDGSSDFAKFIQRGNKVDFSAPANQISTGSATSYTTMGTLLVPTTATVVKFHMDMFTSSGNASIGVDIATDATPTFGDAHYLQVSGTTSSQVNEIFLVLDAPQTAYYYVFGTNARVNIAVNYYEF